MPRALEDKLKRQAIRKGLTGKRRNRYIYGTLSKIKKRRKRE